MSLFSRLAVILFIYGLKLYWFCLATDCRFVIWHCFRLRMFSLELHATFLISSYLLLMFSISIGIFYVNVGILTPCGYSVYLWTQAVLILPSYGLSLCYLTLFPVTHVFVGVACHIPYLQLSVANVFSFNRNILCKCRYSHALRLFCLSMDSSCIDSA